MHCDLEPHNTIDVKLGRSPRTARNGDPNKAWMVKHGAAWWSYECWTDDDCLISTLPPDVISELIQIVSWQNWEIYLLALDTIPSRELVNPIKFRTGQVSTFKYATRKVWNAQGEVSLADGYRMFSWQATFHLCWAAHPSSQRPHCEDKTSAAKTRWDSWSKYWGDQTKKNINIIVT